MIFRARILILVLALATSSAALAQERAEIAGAGETPNSSQSHYLRTDIIGYSVLGLGTLHLIDHGLRRDHSGFPFSLSATPTTFATFTVIPTYLFGLSYDMGPNYWLLADSIIYAATQVAHIVLEPPSHQHGTWQNSRVNALGVESPALGRISQGVSIGLSAALLSHIASSLYDGHVHGFGWARSGRRKSPTALRLDVVPAADGGMVQLGALF